MYGDYEWSYNIYKNTHKEATMEKPFEYSTDERRLKDLHDWLHNPVFKDEESLGADSLIANLKDVFVGTYYDLEGSSGFSFRYKLSAILLMFLLVPLQLKHKRLYFLCDHSYTNITNRDCTFILSRNLDW
jgi:hypothetical protein